MKIFVHKLSCKTKIETKNKKNLLVKFLITICFTGLILKSTVSAADPISSPSPTSSSPTTSTSSVATSSSALKPNETLKPNEALKRLMEGNKRFTEDKTTCPERNQMRRAATVVSQRPFAVVLGCSDSRVPPEIAFDQGIGDVFVVRVAGNIVSAVELDSVEFSALHNNSSVVMVLGHENCGAVNAVLENKTQDIESIANLIQTGLTRFNPKHQRLSLTSAIEANVKNSVLLIKQSPVIDKLIRSGKLMVVGAYYDLKTGAVRILDTEEKGG